MNSGNSKLDTSAIITSSVISFPNGVDARYPIRLFPYVQTMMDEKSKAAEK